MIGKSGRPAILSKSGAETIKGTVINNDLSLNSSANKSFHAPVKNALTKSRADAGLNSHVSIADPSRSTMKRFRKIFVPDMVMAGTAKNLTRARARQSSSICNLFLPKPF